jgi:hypothetical protein
MATVAVATAVSACTVLLARGASAVITALQHRRIVAGTSELNDFIIKVITVQSIATFISKS